MDQSRRQASQKNYPRGSTGTIRVPDARIDDTTGKPIKTLASELKLNGTPAIVKGHTGEGHLVVQPASRYLSVCVEPVEFEIDGDEDEQL